MQSLGPSGLHGLTPEDLLMQTSIATGIFRCWIRKPQSLASVSTESTMGSFYASFRGQRPGDSHSLRGPLTRDVVVPSLPRLD